MKTPTISLEETTREEFKVISFDKQNPIKVPAHRYYALYRNGEEIIGVVYSETNGFPSSYSKRELVLKQFCAGGRPCLLYN
jgi:hypothetical protein